MALILKEKKSLVAEVQEVAKGALSAVVADSVGIKVEKMTDLRKECREYGVYMRVVRNSLISRGMTGSKYSCLKEKLGGTTLMAFSTKHPGSAARILKKNSNLKLKVKSYAFKGEVKQGSEIDRLASIKTNEEAIAGLMSAMQEASVGKLVRTLEAVRYNKECVLAI